MNTPRLRPVPNPSPRPAPAPRPLLDRWFQAWAERAERRWREGAMPLSRYY